MKSDNPQDMIAELLNPKTSGNFSKIIESVSQKVQNKLESGDIDKNKLLGEASSFMNMFGGMNNLQQMMQTQETRSRLKKKLNKRKKKRSSEIVSQ